jgi:hypothetical protein
MKVDLLGDISILQSASLQKPILIQLAGKLLIAVAL